MKQVGNKKEGQVLKSLLSLILLIVVLIPAGIVLFSIFTPVTDSWEHIQKILLPRYILNTIHLSIGVLFFTVLIGVGAAFFVTRYDFPFRNLVDFLLILPMAIPGYIAAIVYSGILDFTGPIQTFIRSHFSVNLGHLRVFDIMSIEGAIFVISITLYPYVYVPVKNAFNSYGLSFIEPAISLGRKNWFFKVLIPITAPAIFGGASLVLMEVLNDFGVVNYFGIEVFQTGIFRAWFSLGELDAAMKLSSILLVFAIIIIVTEKILFKKGRFSSANRVIRPVNKVKPKGYTKILLIVFCLVPVLVGFIIPVLQLLSWFVDSYRDVFNSEFAGLVFNSFSLAGIAVIVSLIFSSIAAIINSGSLPKWISRIFSLITIGYAIPGTVIAVGVMVVFGALDNAQNILIFSGTIFTLVYAYNIRFMAVAYKPISAGLITVNSRYKEASRSLGVSKSKTLFKVELALLKKSFLVSSILLFVDLLKELPLTMILRPFNFDTLATRIYELAGDEMIKQSAVPGLVLIITGLLPIYILNRISEK